MPTYDLNLESGEKASILEQRARLRAQAKRKGRLKHTGDMPATDKEVQAQRELEAVMEEGRLHMPQRSANRPTAYTAKYNLPSNNELHTMLRVEEIRRQRGFLGNKWNALKVGTQNLYYTTGAGIERLAENMMDRAEGVVDWAQGPDIEYNNQNFINSQQPFSFGVDRSAPTLDDSYHKRLTKGVRETVRGLRSITSTKVLEQAEGHPVFREAASEFHDEQAARPWNQPQGAVEGIVSEMPQIGAMTAAQFVPGGSLIAGGMMFAREYEGAYQNSIAQGLDEDTAQDVAFYYGLISAGLEHAQIAGAIKSGRSVTRAMSAAKVLARKGRMKELAKRGGMGVLRSLGAAASEGGVEAAQGQAEDAIRSIIGGTDFKIKPGDRWQEFVAGAALYVLPGLVGGAQQLAVSRGKLRKPALKAISRVANGEQDMVMAHPQQNMGQFVADAQQAGLMVVELPIGGKVRTVAVKDTEAGQMMVDLANRAQDEAATERVASSMAQDLQWPISTTRKLVERAKRRKGDFEENLKQEARDEFRVTPMGLAAMVVENTDAARELAKAKTPSRKEFDAAGLPRRSARTRAMVASDLRELLAEHDRANIPVAEEVPGPPVAQEVSAEEVYGVPQFGPLLAKMEAERLQEEADEQDKASDVAEAVEEEPVPEAPEKEAVSVSEVSGGEAGEVQDGVKAKTTVVDDDGKPLTVYHGSMNLGESFEGIRRDVAPGGRPRKPRGINALGMWFTPERRWAHVYSGANLPAPKRPGKTPRVMSAKINLQNPLVFETADEFMAWSRRMAKLHGEGQLNNVDVEALLKELRRDRHDGIAVKQGMDVGSVDGQGELPDRPVYLVLDSEQVINPTIEPVATKAADPASTAVNVTEMSEADIEAQIAQIAAEKMAEAQQKQEEEPPTKEPVRKPTLTIKGQSLVPMAGQKATVAQAWDGDISEENGKQLVTDGTMMFRKSSVKKADHARLEKRKGLSRPSITQESIKRVWDDAVADAEHDIDLFGIEGATEDMPWDMAYGEVDGQLIGFDAKKLAYAMRVTKADSLKGAGPKNSAVLYRDGEPVALVHTRRVDDDVSLDSLRARRPKPPKKIGRKGAKKKPATPAGDIIITEPRTGRTEKVPTDQGNAAPKKKGKKPTVADRADAATQELNDALGDLGSYLDDVQFSNPLADPKLWSLTGKVIAKSVKAGVYRFADMVQRTAAAIGEQRARRLGPVLKEAWNGLRERDTSGRMDMSSDVDSILDSVEDAGDGHEAGGSEDSSRGPQGTQVGSGPRRQGSGDDVGSVEADAPADAGSTPEAGGGEAVGETAGGTGVRADGGATGPPTVADGRTGAVGEGLVSDRGGREGSAGESAVGSTGSDRDDGQATVADVQPNYRITDPESLVGGGPKTKFARNRKALETYFDVVDANRAPTNEERDAMASYIGWGSFGQELFNGSWEQPKPKEGWEDEDAWLREHLGEKRWKSAQRSIINAHYTDPPTVSAMWDMVRRMGFEGGRVLEPSMGVGNFFGLMPDDLAANSDLTGIELDEVTGGMAKLLYPQANISIKGYQDSQTPDNFYDLVIGNWPFAADGPADRRYNKLSPTLHDYFFLKALDQVRPGGLVVGITSSGTMDKLGQQARLEMSKKADLVASYRLPTGAFGKYAGTAVVTDIIILRKRGEESGIQHVPSWVGTTEVRTPAGPKVRINTYYDENPGHVLGTLNHGHGTTRGRPGMIVERTDDYESRLASAIESLEGGVYEKRSAGQSKRYVTNNSEERVNSVMVDDDGGLWLSRGEQKIRLEDERRIAIKDQKKTEARREQIRRLVNIRQVLGEVVDQQREGSDSTEESRARLRKAYRAFTKKFGPINKSYALATLKKVGDPHYPQLAALEHNTAGHDDKPQYVESAILTRSTTRARPRPKNMTVQDAYVFQRNEGLDIDIARIAELAKVSEDEAVDVLEKDNALFRTPAGTLEHADEYLAGNVRLKLREARNAKKEGVEGMDRNIEALEKVVPEDVPYYSIEAKLGNNWTPVEVYKQFIAEMLGVADDAKAREGIDVVFSPQGWKVRLSPDLANRSEANSNYGTLSARFNKLVEHAMRSTPIAVRTRDDDGNSVVDQKATDEANEKIANMQEHFTTWVWKDPTRRIELERTYNESMNNAASPHFSGDWLAFEGMMLERGEKPFNLRQHQVSAIARGLVLGRGIYAHEVGTGKTYTMGGIAIESRRYGKAKKPLIFAHNANSATVAAEINEMYPGAKVLYVDNLSKSNRDVTLAQIVNDDWDAIVVPHSMADKFALRSETYSALAAAEIAELEAAALEAAEEDGVALDVTMMSSEEDMRGVRSPTAKDLVRARNKIIQRIDRMAQRASENAIILEDAGVDMLIVDEAHEFKKPPIATTMRMKGLNTAPSNRSINMMFMLQYVNEINSGRGVHLFTGTPITNTLNELYNMMRYVMPSELKAEGLAHWDAWFNAFAAEMTDIEVTPAGDYEPTSRLASFVNVPELRRMAGQFMDTVFAEEMPEFESRKAPSGKEMGDKDLTDGEREFLANGRTEEAVGRPYKIVKTVVAPMTEAQRAIRHDLMVRANRFRQMTGKERREAMLSGDDSTPLRVEGDAAKAGLDPRLFDMAAPDDPASKVNTAINTVMKHYDEHDLSCQVLFMERGFSDSVTRTRTVGEDQNRRKIRERFETHNLAKDIVEKLVERGVPREQIAIVDGKMNKQKRKAVADAMNTGEVRVVIGSTQTLGTGVNMQQNLRAMHHLDAPWRPGDLEQRNGRGHRQGNKWNSVLEYRYVTEGIDGRRWQVLVVKDKFIQDFLRSKGNQRVIEGDAAAIDDDGGGSDLASTLSEATGDPRILQVEKAKKDIDRLQRRERLHSEGLYETRSLLQAEEGKQRDLQEAIRQRELIEKVLAETEGQPFAMTLAGHEYDSRKDADAALDQLKMYFREGAAGAKDLGAYRGFTMKGYEEKGWFSSNSVSTILLSHPDLPDTAFGFGLTAKASVSGVEAILRNNKKNMKKHRADLEESKRVEERLTKSLDVPFPQQDKLNKAIAKLSELEIDLDRNPVPPPSWLRQPTPTGSTVMFQGDERIVDGHRWSNEGWFVVLEPKSKGEKPTEAPYLDVMDEQGVPIYEEHAFEPPDLAGGSHSGSGGDAMAALSDRDSYKSPGDGAMGYAARTTSRPTRKIGRKMQNGESVTNKQQLVQPSEIIDTIRRLWPELSIRGKATFTKQMPGWYRAALGEMRLKDSGDIVVAVHELGHHFDVQLNRWSRKRGMPKEIAGELRQLGKDLYGDEKPAAGYKAEGFAEFIGHYLTGADIGQRAPHLHQWFTTEYLPAHPAEARKLRTLEDVIARFQLQTPEQAVRAFRQPRRQDWSARRTAAARAAETQHRDENLSVLRAMQDTGADLDAVRPTDHPYMLLTAHARSAGGRTLHSAIGGTVDLRGRRNGKGLRQALEAVAEMGAEEMEKFVDYAIARRAIDLHDRKINPGIKLEDARAVVHKYESPAFAQTLREVTAWSRRTLHLLVEAGAMTESEFRDIVETNPVYVPFARQFLPGELRAGKGSGRGVYRIQGSGREIHNPIDMLILQAEQITETAMQADVLRAMVKFYDSQVGKASGLSKMMSEVPAPTEATTFSAEKIKKEMAAKAVELGADPDEVAAAMLKVWEERITVFNKADEYRGKDNIISVVVGGERRFFEIQPDLVSILEGMRNVGMIPGKLGELSRAVVGLQRLGATGLNPAFNLLRNPLRDTMTAAVTADYHFHIPILSSIRGSLMDIMGTDMAEMYHAMGIDIAGRVGQDMRAARRASKRAMATTKLGRLRAMGLISGVREILSHSEVGPRLMEFQGAYQHGLNTWGDSGDAAVLAACAAKDITVNFSRAGSVGRKVNEAVLFYNASIQSVDKLARTMGAAEAAPWAKHKSRKTNLARTMARGVSMLTSVAVLNYLRNRDEEWWKELPAHEKWGYIHVAAPGESKVIARVPLPFEAGSVFAALPVALLEERRTPGAFAEALATSLQSASPLDVSSWHGMASNIALVSPIADVLANEDWKGADIVSENIQDNNLPAYQYGPRTSWLARLIGGHVPGGYSPAKIDHLMNGYTGGLYRRLAGAIETATDPSAIGKDGDLSTLPVFGTLFLRPGTSRTINDFYERMTLLRQRKGSNAATLEEIGELAASERLSTKVGELWAKRREAITSDQSAGDIKSITDRLLAQVQEHVREHQTRDDFRQVGMAAMLRRATAPGADPEDVHEAKRVLAGVSRSEAIQALRDDTRRRGRSVRMRSKSGRLSAYGRRVMRIRRLLEGE